MYMVEEQPIPPPHGTSNPPPYYVTSNPPVTTQSATINSAQPDQTVIIQRTIVPVYIQQPMGYMACVKHCKSCNMQLTTRVERKPACRTHLCAGALCMIGCWPCVVVPYFTNPCNDADHYCSNCGSYIGSYRG